MNQNSNTQSRTVDIALDTIAQGDCIEVMRRMPEASVDLILTDPPYLVNYRSSDGRRVPSDTDDRWLKPAFAEAFRVLTPDRFCVCFYGWSKADKFLAAWREAGLRPVGHLVFQKSYASSTRFLRYHHEQAYLLAKGRPKPPSCPIADVLRLRYTGNRLHPTQKAVSALEPLISSFSAAGEVVLDPFCGSGSTLVAAHSLGRRFLGIELDENYHAIATRRLNEETTTTEGCS